MRLSMSGINIPAFAFAAEAGPQLVTDPKGMEGWVGLGSTMVSKQFAVDRCVTEISY